MKTIITWQILCRLAMDAKTGKNAWTSKIKEAILNAEEIDCRNLYKRGDAIEELRAGPHNFKKQGLKILAEIIGASKVVIKVDFSSNCFSPCFANQQNWEKWLANSENIN